MTVANVTLPLLAAILLSGNAVALAGASSALDPYAHIQAPTRAEKEAMLNKGKKPKAKVKKVAAVLDDEPAPRRKGIETVPASTVVNERPRTARKVEFAPTKPSASEDEPERTQKTASQQSTKVSKESKDDGPEQGEGFLDGIKQSTAGIAKSTRAIGSGMMSGPKYVGSKFSGMGSAVSGMGSGLKDKTLAGAGKIADLPAKIGGGLITGGEKVLDNGSSVTSKMWGGATAAGEKLMSLGSGDGARKIVAAPVAGFGAIGHGLSKLNPFGGDDDKDSKSSKDAPKAIAEKTKAVKADSKKKSAESPAIAATKTAKPSKGDSSSSDAMTKATSQEKVVATSESTEDAAEVATEKTKEAAKPELAKKETKAAPVKTAEAPKEKSGIGFGLGLGTAKKLAAAPVAGMSKLGGGLTKLNPFHKDGKQAAPEAIAKKPAATTPAEKAVEPKTAAETTASAPAPTTSPESTNNAPQIGERIQPPDEESTETPGWSVPEAKSTAASPDAIPH